VQQLVLFLIIVYACSSLLIGSIGLWLLVFFLMLMALIPHNVFLILFTFIGSIAAILTAIGLFNALLPMSSLCGVLIILHLILLYLVFFLINFMPH
jgi:hypothetical protein